MYKFYLDGIMLPIAPGEMKLKIKNQNKTFSLINDGELNILKTPGLSEFTLSKVLLPNTRYPFAEYPKGYKDALYYTKALEKLKTQRKSFPFVVIRQLGSKKVGLDTNITVSLESYTLTESAENGTDLLADITLKQYVAYGTKTLVIKQNKATASTTRSAPTKSASTASTKKYTIKTGDTLWGIARTQYGDGNKWKKIYTANKKVLDDKAVSRGFPKGTGDRWIFTGTVITIPPK